MAVFIEFDDDARAEFDEAFRWYAERSVGAAIGFATEIEVAIEAIVEGLAFDPVTAFPGIAA